MPVQSPLREGCMEEGRPPNETSAAAGQSRQSRAPSRHVKDSGSARLVQKPQPLILVRHQRDGDELTYSACSPFDLAGFLPGSSKQQPALSRFQTVSHPTSCIIIASDARVRRCIASDNSNLCYRALYTLHSAARYKKVQYASFAVPRYERKSRGNTVPTRAQHRATRKEKIFRSSRT
ncbi:hypothetical protein DPSP01_003124 [Paraphaeosphaeria sporulosa]